MRISDWSSDVCSSDLQQFCGGALILSLVAGHGEQQAPLCPRDADDARAFIKRTPQQPRRVGYHKCKGVTHAVHIVSILTICNTPVRAAVFAHARRLECRGPTPARVS